MTNFWILDIPDNQQLLAAIGRVSASHAQLELVLKYCIKTTARIPVEEALHAENKKKMYELRERIRKLFKQAGATEANITRLDALLGRADQLSDQRNKLIHRPWKKTKQGGYEVKGDDHNWGAAPTQETLNQLADNILYLVKEINEARLRGFINETMNP